MVRNPAYRLLPRGPILALPSETTVIVGTVGTIFDKRTAAGRIWVKILS